MHDNSLEMKSVVVLYIVALLQPVLQGKIIEEKLEKGYFKESCLIKNILIIEINKITTIKLLLQLSLKG